MESGLQRGFLRDSRCVVHQAWRTADKHQSRWSDCGKNREGHYSNDPAGIRSAHFQEDPIGEICGEQLESGKQLLVIFRFDGVLRQLPSSPSIFQRENLRVTFPHKEQCRTDTGRVVQSLAVKNDCLILWVFVDPRTRVAEICTNRALDLGLTLVPVMACPYIKDH